MTPHRTFVRSLIAATGLLAIAAPAMAIAPAVPTAAAPSEAAPVLAAASPVGTGTAATTSVPIHVAVGDLPVDLGTTVVSATNDPAATSLAPWSGAAVTLANIGGARFGDLSVRSDGSTANNGATLARDTLAGPVGATVGNLVATADVAANSATAGLTTLTTTASVLEGPGLGLTATVTNVVSSVDDTGASATHGLAVAGIDLELGHVLGDALDLLSLEQLLDLADLFDGIDLPDALDVTDDVAVAIEELLAAIADVDAATAGVQDAAAALLGSDDAAQLVALDALLGDLDALDPLSLTFAADLLALLSSPTGTSTGCTDVVLADAIACVEAAADVAAASLGGPLGDLEAAVQEYLDAVDAAQIAAALLDTAAIELPDALDGLLDDIGALIEELLGINLLSLGEVQVAQSVRAVGDDLDASSASAVCQTTLVSVLDGTPLAIEDCSAPSAELETLETLVEDTLGQVLTAVGGVDVGDGVELDIFGVVENATTELDGVVTATSSVEVLSLTVPEITVTPCDVLVVGEAACLLLPTLDGTLGETLDTVTGALGTAQSAVAEVLTGDELAALLALLEGVDIADISVVDNAGAGVDTVLGAVDGLIAGLNLVGVLDGEALTLPGAEIVVDPQLEARHSVTAAGAPTDPAPTPTNPAPTPSDPSLPNTGGGAALLAVLALGAGAWLWRRKETGEA